MKEDEATLFCVSHLAALLKLNTLESLCNSKVLTSDFKIREYISSLPIHNIRKVLKIENADEIDPGMLHWASSHEEKGEASDYMSVSQTQNSLYSNTAVREELPDLFLSRILLETRSGDFALFQDDDSTSRCNKCGEALADTPLLSVQTALAPFQKRKHHCRSCGKIFCHSCSSHFVELGQQDKVRTNGWVVAFNDKTWGDRLCDWCAPRLEEKQRVFLYIDVFYRLALDLPLAKQAVRVSHKWEIAIKYYFRSLHELQYLAPTHTLSPTQKEMLWSNRMLCQGHRRWLVLLVKAAVGFPEREKEVADLLRQPRVFTCRNLYCSSQCAPELLAPDAIELLSHPGVPLDIRRFLVQVLRSETAFMSAGLRTTELECYIPTLVQSLIYDIRGELANFLIEEAIAAFRTDQGSRAFCVFLFWWLGVLTERSPELDFVRSRLLIDLASLDRDAALGLAEGSHLTALIEKVPNSTSTGLQQLQDNLDHVCNATKPLLVPTDPDHPVTHIDVLHPKVFESTTRPVSFSYSRQHGEVCAFMYKQEDVRKDCVVTSLIKLMNHILVCAELNLNILTYRCIPLSSESGLVEMVPHSKTIADIKRQDPAPGAITNWIQNLNTKKVLETVRRQLVESMAPYCVISYLLGFGDRHWDNILLTQDATLFHIDYGFIMGQNPANKLFMPYVRISGELIQAIGGEHSQDYQRFEELMKQTFVILRRHSNLFITLLKFLPDFDTLPLEIIQQQVSWRFLPGVTDEEAVATFLTRVKASRDTIGARMTDASHELPSLLASLTGSKIKSQPASPL